MDSISIISKNVTSRSSQLKKNLWIRSKALIISNDEMEDIMKIVKLLEESGLLVKGAKTIAKQKNKKDDFFQCH